VTAEHSRGRGPAAGRRQVAHLEAGRLKEHLEGQVGGPVESGRGEGDFPGALLRVVDELLQGLPGPVHDEDGRIGVEPRDPHELIPRVRGGPAEELVHLRGRGDADERDKEGVAVRLGHGRELRPHGARGTRLVDDDDGLLEEALEGRGERAAGEIGDAARREGIDDGDGPGRVRLLGGDARDQRGQRKDDADSVKRATR